MKLRIKKSFNILILVSVLLLTVAVILFATINLEAAEAANLSGAITVSYDGEKYVYSDGSGNGGSDSSLQNVIDSAQSGTATAIFVFDRLPVTEPVTFRGKVIAQGALNFTLSGNDYAATVKNGSETVFSGLVINSNRGGVTVEYGANFRLDSGAVIISDCDEMCSALDVQGFAEIKGGNLIYSESNMALGYGASVNGGELVVNEETPVRVEGHTGICISAGKAVINGGEIIANKNINVNNNSGYSADAQNGELTVNGGSFPSPIYNRLLSGGIFSLNGGDISSVVVSPYANKSFSVGELDIVAGVYCPTEIEFLSDTEIKISGKKQGGFRIAGFTVGNDNTDETELIIGTNEKKTVTPIEDNRYKVSLISDGSIYKTLLFTYNSTVELSSLPVPDKRGYSLKGFVERDGSFRIVDDIILTAITELSAPEIVLNDTEFAYNGEEHTVSPVVRHELNVSFNSYWERYNSGSWNKICDGNDLNVKYVKDSGKYRFTVAAEYGDDLSSSSEEITVEVKKGSYSDISHPSLNGVYSPTKRLISYELLPYFRWADGSVVPTVNQKSYLAIYNADRENYEDYNLNINLDLTKAAAVAAPVHRDLSGVYEGKALSEYALDDGFRWKYPDTVPIVKTQVYLALYSPDEVNYEFSEIYLILKLTKGNYGDDKKLDKISFTYRPDYYLSDFYEAFLQSHENYRLNFADAKINAGATEIQCVYNADADNYNDLIFTLILDVAKADYESGSVPDCPTFSGVYSGLPLSSYTLPQFLRWENPELVPTVAVTEYRAFYNAEPENYNDYPISVRFILQKGEYDVSIIELPVLEAVTYDRDLTLSKIPLPSGWEWSDGSINPTVAVNLYSAEYCLDTENYNSLSVSISLSVLKANIPSAVLKDKTFVYDGEEHFLSFDYIPYPMELIKFENNGRINAGKSEVVAKLRQTDVDNYNLHPTTVRAFLTVLKAPSVINAPIRYDIAEGKEVTLTGSVNNDEQRLIIPEFNETEAGIYTVYLTTAESANYLAGQFAVTVSINKTDKYIGNVKYPSDYDGTYFFGIISDENNGIPNDAEIIFRPTETDDINTIGIEISVKVNGEAYKGNFLVKIRMTEKMLSASSMRLFNEGKETAYHIENKVYLVFETDGNEIFDLVCEYKNEFQWWWIPIGLGAGLAAIFIVLAILWKKGIIKLPTRKKSEETANICDESEAETSKETESEENGDKK